MTPQERVTQLAQSIYLAKNGRYNDVDGSELTDFLNQTVDWVNQYLEELEYEAEWNYLRTNQQLIASINDLTVQAFDLPEGVRTIVVSPYRDIVIKQDDVTISTFTMVNPNQISDPTYTERQDRATVINRKLVLSRPLKDTELNGDIKADTIAFMPKLALDNADVLDLVKPQQLIVLGVSKNATLPDIVQGGISPSLTQKYNDLLQKAIGINGQTAEVLDMPSENFGWVRGVW